MRVYLTEDKSEFVEVLAMVAKVSSRTQSEKEKRIGLEFLDISSNGKQYFYHVNKDTAFTYGITERYLKRLCDELLDASQEKINLVDFHRNRKGEVYVKPVQIRNTYTSTGRASRRYLLVSYKGKIVMTDVIRLNQVTKHYKKDRDRNERGLEWENYASLLKSGGAFNMSRA